MFQFQVLSKHGASRPSVARTLPQGCDLLEFFVCDEAMKEGCKKSLYELSRLVSRCVEAYEPVEREVAKNAALLMARGPTTYVQGNAIHLPGVPDLASLAENFWQSAKLAIAETARLVHPFYGVAYDHKYHLLANWAEKKFGKEDVLATTVRHWEPWVKEVVTWRNAVDHPKEVPGGKLETKNFHLASGSSELKVLDPLWNLNGSPERPIAEHMAEVIEGLLRLGEEVMVALFEHFRSSLSIVIVEIPENERDPLFPKRLRVTLAGEL